MTSVRVRAFAAVAAISALTGGLVVAGVASAAPGCKVDYVVQNKWQGGFTGNVTITNLGDPVDGWALRWSFPGSERFGQGWNATFSASGASVTASNVDWNRSIPTGGTASFGFNGTMTGDAVGVPATFTLNGTTCTGGTVPTTTSSTSTSTTTTTTTTGGGTPQCSTSPVNPNASVQARKLLCYVQSQYGNHIISGQQESTWIGGPDYEINHIRNNTGKYPAIRALDFGDSKDLAPRAVAWWNAGGIPMIGYHMGAPTKPDTYEGTQMQVSINAVLTPGTAEYQSFMQRLDQAAAMLQQLENAGAAVIWRPFHEAGGTWFWWSKEGGGQYNRLWNFMFNYFTRTKGLDNLVWLHGYNGQPQASFYPGKSVVDIGGADTYAGNGNYDPLNAMYNSVRNIVGSTLPIALHENGPIPDPDRLQSTGTRWVLFGTWHGNHLTVSNSIAHLQKVYNHSYVVTRDELPNLR
ncbi:glycosyl hydrolase [Saccharothrix luteola]|uniref:glycosyl hydrolase n=1 Tax=Saccharothrix luteola TaxID=2893018 RepID=UPI001E5BBDF0|nr:glycosyl hydrolase [Saccharothrix luteola]MCC8251519.1 cellulose binding domain-containing protein [Saccharothrix luteola]MCC8251520.1 cellulose binding domain-containing protein [Saccharothrix luteola]